MRSSGLLSWPLLFFVLAVGCRQQAAPPPQVIVTRVTAEELDQAILNGNSRLQRSGADFGTTLNRFLRQEKMEAGAMRRRYESVLETVQSVQSDIRELTPPETESAQVLYNVYERYLILQDRTCREDFMQIVAVVEDEQLAFNEKKNAILPILQMATEEDQTSLTSLKAARLRFGKAHDLSWAAE